MEESKFELVLQMSDNGIICNAKTLKNMLPEKLRVYQYVVDETNVDKAKTDRAKLNNMVKLLSSKRIEFEKTAFEDWNKAKPILMEIEKNIKAAGDALGDGIKDLEEKEKLSKMEEVRQEALYVLPSLHIQVPFEKLYDRKSYDKKTMTVKKIKEDMQIKVNTIENDWELMQLFIDGLTEAEIEQVKEEYSNNFNSEPMSHAKSLADRLHQIHEKVSHTQNNEVSEDIPNNLPYQEDDYAQELNENKVDVEKTKNNDLDTSKTTLLSRIFGIKADIKFFEEMNILVDKYNAEIMLVIKDDEEIEKWIKKA